MRVAVFFLFLFFCLLKGDNSAFAGAGGFTFGAHIQKAQQLKYTGTSKRCWEITAINLNPEKQLLITEDNEEDEDAENSVTRKYRSLATCYLTPSCLFILSSLYSGFKAPRPFCGHLSYKYDAQRVLRI